MKRSLSAATAALALLAAMPASAVTVSADFDVDAALNSSTGGTGLATGIIFALGDAFTSSSDLLDTWSLGATASRTGNADGLLAFPDYTAYGLTTRYGTLVGRIGSGDYFAIGTSFSGNANASGELLLYNWDSNAYDNSGSIMATISYDNGIPAVPLPASGLFLAGGLLGLMWRRKTQTQA